MQNFASPRIALLPLLVAAVGALSGCSVAAEDDDTGASIDEISTSSPPFGGSSGASSSGFGF